MSAPAREEDEEQRVLSPEENRQARSRSLTLLRELLHPVRGQFAAMSVMVVIAQLAVVAGPAIIAWGIDNALTPMVEGNPAPALGAAALHLSCAIVGGVLTFGYVRQGTVVGERMLLSLRRKVFRFTQKQDLEFHERYTSGRMVSRQTSDMEALRELVDSGVDILVGSTLSMVFTVILIVTMDWVTGVVMLLMLIPGVMLTSWFQKRSREQYRQIRTHSARLIVHFVETMGGIRAVQAFRKEPADEKRFDDLAQDYRDASLASTMTFGIYQPALRILANATIAVVLLVGGFRVLGGHLEVGSLVALALYSRRFFQPIDQLASFYNTLQSGLSALEKIATLLAESPSVKESEHPTPMPASTGRVDFEDVSFRYTADGPLVLKPLDLHIPPGQTIALVGQTGAGKSTVAKLISRFYDATEGEVLLDGVDLRDISMEDLTRNIVMVTQEAYLFSGTVADNIELGMPGAPREDIERAARAIGADDFIENLPDGYDTDVNKRGGRVSAGQRQLISFARAFLADPRVLILDEATSSLDIPSERMVQEGLTKLLGERTALIIAHRLSTVMIADRVLVVHGGEVVEDGSPAELVAAGGRFAALYQAWQESL
ncbi:ABC transporter ATP-binding protein/permease [Brachybacterium halotolerans subsp. kimchii]|uniref:ABC transporter ATP-binding protein n=1 Tax=Brachybacterium TaxID=43668 RepID=UPI001E2E620F|nr:MULTISPECIES: ABC transporter ATP-binding protein [Brachybacterium]MCG7308919.1 ABC transporter ATP-binding protein/permease [Brachybacterium sp. ACRRE]UEJ81197.1 ABC transporter ATP-binding protein/permease [Brachybacterium halotolerans subsp. kimchii]